VACIEREYERGKKREERLDERRDCWERRKKRKNKDEPSE